MSVLALIGGLAMLGTRPGRTRDRRIALALASLAFIAVILSAWLSHAEAVWIQAWWRWRVASAIGATLLFLATLHELSLLINRKDRP